MEEVHKRLLGEGRPEVVDITDTNHSNSLSILINFFSHTSLSTIDFELSSGSVGTLYAVCEAIREKSQS